VEAANLVYHVLVAMRVLGLEDVRRVLRERME
jgi:phosphoribosyl-ATP pyrophosphohydrolase